jgi:hypothetical protein
VVEVVVVGGEFGYIAEVVVCEEFGYVVKVVVFGGEFGYITEVVVVDWR